MPEQPFGGYRNTYAISSLGKLAFDEHVLKQLREKYFKLNPSLTEQYSLGVLIFTERDEDTCCSCEKYALMKRHVQLLQMILEVFTLLTTNMLKKITPEVSMDIP